MAESSVCFGANQPLELDGTRAGPFVTSVDPRITFVPEGRGMVFAWNGKLPEAGERVMVGVDIVARGNVEAT